jgi:hypothetical protein
VTTQPKLGWWLQLVSSSAFANDELPAVVKKHWGTDLIGASVCEIDWEGTPLPDSISMYGTVEDGPPDLGAMAEAVRPYMEDDEYFVFLYSMNPVLSDDGFQCIVITNNTYLVEHGRAFTEGALKMALTTDQWFRKMARVPDNPRKRKV